MSEVLLINGKTLKHILSLVICIYYLTCSEEGEVLGVRSIPVEIFPSYQDMKSTVHIMMA